MKILLSLVLLALGTRLPAQIPVTDIANLVNNQLSEIENLAKWVESIAQLRQQITQLDQQINLQTDLRRWAGDPRAAGSRVLLNSFGEADLVREYGRAQADIRSLTNSLDSLTNTDHGNFRAIVSLDIDGNALSRDPLSFRRFSVLDATQANTEQVTSDTQTREQALQEDIAATLEELKTADTEAETQKLSAKLTALNGQLGQVESVRRREVDAVALQKIANDSRAEEERLAAAELAAKDDHLANQRISAYMRTLHLRQNEGN